MALQWETATEDEIIQHCSRDNPDRQIISELDGGHSVIRISEDVVVKCSGVTECEVANQRWAYQVLNPDSIRVPQVYRFFIRDLNGFPWGYLVMEYLKGQTLSDVADPDIYLEPMVKALNIFEQLQRDRPGPFYQGPAFGQLWLDYDPPTIDTVSDIEKYYNKKQLKDLTHINLVGYPQVFCHLDLAPRNIIVLEDGSLGLIDWTSAGFYPRLFERCMIYLNIRGVDSWNSKLLARLCELDESEKAQLELLKKAYYLAQRYS